MSQVVPVFPPQFWKANLRFAFSRRLKAMSLSQPNEMSNTALNKGFQVHHASNHAIQS